MSIKHSLCQKANTTTLYNSQIGAVVFLCVLSYKLSALPSIAGEYLSSSTLWFYLVLSVFDTIEFALLYFFFYDGSDERLKDKLAYKIGLIFLTIFLGLKCIAYFSFAVLFFTVELYVGISPIIVVAILIAPILYLGLKGGKTIGRTAEILAPIVFTIIVLNLIFLDSHTDFRRNLPVLAVPLKDFALHSLKYGTWLGNFFPLLFVKVKNKTFPYISTSVATTQLLTLAVILVGVAMYGDAMKILGNLLVEISGFNQLSTEIGRMEWTSLFAVIVMGVMEMAFLFYGLTECSVRLVNSKFPATILVVVVVFLLSILLPSPQIIADISHTTEFGIVMFILSLILPIYFLTVKVFYKKKEQKATTFDFSQKSKQASRQDVAEVNHQMDKTAVPKGDNL